MGEIFSCLSQFRHLCKGVRRLPSLNFRTGALTFCMALVDVQWVKSSTPIYTIVYIISPWYLILLLFDYVKVTDTTSATI